MDTAGLYHRVMRDVLARSKVHHFGISPWISFNPSHTEGVCRRTFVRKHLGKLATVCFNSIPSSMFDKEYNHLYV